MNRYRIICDDGCQYDVMANAMDVTEQWIKFFDYDLVRDKLHLFAVIKATNVNNVKLVDIQTGKTDRIVTV